MNVAASLPPVRVLMNWSGGKDSALALYRLLRDPAYSVTDLLTTLNGPNGRVSMHGVRQELVAAQARRIGLPLHTLALPDPTPMADYARQLADTLRPVAAGGVTHAAYGDLFLEDLRQWREQQLAAVGLTGLFPLWRLDSRALLEEFWAAGFRTIVVAVNGQILDPSFCGRDLDRGFVADLPPGVDPCGENGEFHTFVVDAPYFSRPISVKRGETVERTYCFTDAAGRAHTSLYYFTDLLPMP